MPPARRMPPKPAADPASSLANTIASHPIGRRWACLALRHFALWSVPRIAKDVKGVTYATVCRWERKLDDSGDLLDAVREKAGPKVSASELKKTQDALTSGGTGQRKNQSLRRAYPKLQAAGDVTVSRETLRLALHSALWSCQRIRKRLPLGKTEPGRLAFCRKWFRDIAKRAAFSDSKYFEGETSSKGTAQYAWAPNGKPLCEFVKYL